MANARDPRIEALLANISNINLDELDDEATCAALIKRLEENVAEDDEEINRLGTRLNAAKAHAAELDIEHGAIHARMDAADVQIAHADTQIQAADARVAALQIRQAGLAVQREQLGAQSKVLAAQSAESETHIAKEERDIAEIKVTNAAAKKERRENEQSAERLDVRINAAKAHAAELDIEHGAIHARMDAADVQIAHADTQIQAADARVATLQIRQAGLAVQREQLGAQSKVLAAQSAESETHIAKEERDIAEIKVTNAAAKKERRENEQSAERLDVRINAAKAHAAELDIEHGAIHARMDAADVQIAHADTQIQAADARVATLQIRQAGLAVQREQLGAQSKVLAAQSAESETHIAKEERDIAEIKVTNAAAKKERRENEKSVERLDTSTAASKVRIVENTKCIEEENATQKKLQAEIKTLVQELTTATITNRTTPHNKGNATDAAKLASLSDRENSERKKNYPSLSSQSTMSANADGLSFSRRPTKTLSDSGASDRDGNIQNESELKIIATATKADMPKKKGFLSRFSFLRLNPVSSAATQPAKQKKFQ